MISSTGEDAVQQDHRGTEGNGKLAPVDGKVMFSGEAGDKLHSATLQSHASPGTHTRKQQDTSERMSTATMFKTLKIRKHSKHIWQQENRLL